MYISDTPDNSWRIIRTSELGMTREYFEQTCVPSARSQQWPGAMHAARDWYCDHWWSANFSDCTQFRNIPMAKIRGNLRWNNVASGWLDWLEWLIIVRDCDSATPTQCHLSSAGKDVADSLMISHRFRGHCRWWWNCVQWSAWGLKIVCYRLP